MDAAMLSRGSAVGENTPAHLVTSFLRFFVTAVRRSIVATQPQKKKRTAREREKKTTPPAPRATPPWHITAQNAVFRLVLLLRQIASSFETAHPGTLNHFRTSAEP